MSSIILGVVEGLTEFLPISSTGHLILSSRILNIPLTDFLKTFEIVIQLGAILAVVLLYWKYFVGAGSFENLKKIVIAFIPTGIVGFLLYKVIINWLGSDKIVLWSLFLGGAVLIIFELSHKEEKGLEKLADVSYSQSFFIGVFQALSVIPGVSRAAASIVGGLALGLKRKTAVEFSFLLAVPTMLAAAGYDALKNLNEFSASNSGLLIVGFIVSFLAAIIAVRFLINFIKKRNFIPFGIYRILVALIFWFIIF